jgi:hypothetical protein
LPKHGLAPFTKMPNSCFKPCFYGILAFFVLFSSGCSSTEERLAPEVDLGESKLLIVPFQEKGQRVSALRWHYESEEGIRLAQSLELQMSGDCPTLTPISDSSVEEQVFHTDTDEVPWSRIGRAVDATHVLTGRIEKISFRDPRTPGMLQGRYVVRWWIYQVSDGARISSREFNVRVPEDPESGKIYVSFETSERELLAALRAQMAQLIALTLCGAEVE